MVEPQATLEESMGKPFGLPKKHTPPLLVDLKDSQTLEEFDLAFSK